MKTPKLVYIALALLGAALAAASKVVNEVIAVYPF